MKTSLCLLVACCKLFVAHAQQKDPALLFLSTQKKRVKVVLEAAQFNAGDKVADIGTGNGWFAAVLGMYTDSLSFTLEDIDSTILKGADFEKTLLTYEKALGRHVTNNYQFQIGNEKSSMLPKSTFDKVLLLDVFHHVTFREAMIEDLHSILKQGGRLVVLEPIGRKAGEIYKGCQSVIFTPADIIAAFISQGFAHERTLKTVKSTRKRVRAFVFKKVGSP